MMQRHETLIKLERVTFRLIQSDALIQQFCKGQRFNYHEIYEQTTIFPEFILNLNQLKQYKIIFMEKNPPTNFPDTNEFSWGMQKKKIYLICCFINDENCFNGQLDRALRTIPPEEQPQPHQIILIGIKDSNKKTFAQTNFTSFCSNANFLDFALVNVCKPQECRAIIQLALLHHEYHQYGYLNIPTPLKTYISEKNPFKHTKNDLNKFFFKSKNSYLCQKNFYSLEHLSLQKITSAYEKGQAQYSLNFTNKFFTFSSFFGHLQTPEQICQIRKNNLLINTHSYLALYFFLMGEGSYKLNGLKFFVLKNLFPEMSADTEESFKHQALLLTKYLYELDEVQIAIKSITFILCMNHYKERTLPKELNIFILEQFVIESAPNLLNNYNAQSINIISQ